MNIVTKKEETLRLEDLIKNEEESLKAREIDIKKDEKLVKKFVESVQEAAEQAIKDTENELKIKEEKTMKHNQLQNEEEKLKNQKEKLVEELDQLKKYKEFLQELGKQRISLKKEKEKKEIKPVQKVQKEKEKTLFLTEQQQNKDNEGKQDQNTGQIEQIKEEENEENENPFTETQQVLDLLEIIEEKNLYLIQNQSETTADLEKLNNEKKELASLLQAKKNDWEEKKSVVDKQKEIALKRYRALTNEFNKFEKNKFQINEQKEIDMDALSEIILSISRDIEQAKESTEQNVNKKKPGTMTLSMMKTTDQGKNLKQKQAVNPEELYNCFKMIEDKFRKAEVDLNRQQKLYESNKKTKIEKMEREKRNYNILEQYKQEKRAKENQLREQKEKEEQQKKLQKKLQAQQRAQHFGRKPMTKILFDEDKQEKETILSDHDDSDNKYYNESFDLGNSSPEKSAKPNVQHQQANNVQILKNI